VGKDKNWYDPAMRILIVEDDARIALPLKEELEHQQHFVQVAEDGELGFNLSAAENYDLILVDVMLPKLDGVRLCEKLRAHGCEASIIMITARDTTANKIIGLDAGADDYLVKPFEVEELLARIRAVMRRNKEPRDQVLMWGDLSLDTALCEARFNSQLIDLTPTEFKLLAHFLRNPQRTFSKDALITRLWLNEEPPTDDVIKTHIKGLRQGLSRAGAPREMIETVYGFGYRLKRHVQ
jgi:two-component system, OmpR family, response regulator QseB